MKWAIITGEYPPQPGGVSDYTRLVAQGFAAAGDEVHVWAPDCPQPAPHDQGVYVHRLPGHFGPQALRTLSSALAQLQEPYRILVQYVPHAYGWKAMNLPFSFWVASRSHFRPWVMFHEVAFPIASGQPLRHNLLGVVTRLMAMLVARAAEHIFVAIPEWDTWLRRITPGKLSIHSLPVPSNVPTNVDFASVAELRARIATDPETALIGHFGTFGSHTASMLAAVLVPLLAGDSNRVGVLVGRGGEDFARDLVRAQPNLERRLYATGGLTAEQVSLHLAACDLLVQPYPDGASSRRGSLMGGLGLGLPIVTTQGRLTEPHWEESQAVALASTSSPDDFIATAEALLQNPDARAGLGRRARRIYKDKFAVEKTVSEMRRLAIQESQNSRKAVSFTHGCS